MHFFKTLFKSFYRVGSWPAYFSSSELWWNTRWFCSIWRSIVCLWPCPAPALPLYKLKWCRRPGPSARLATAAPRFHPNPQLSALERLYPSTMRKWWDRTGLCLALTSSVWLSSLSFLCYSFSSTSWLWPSNGRIQAKCIINNATSHKQPKTLLFS